MPYKHQADSYRIRAGLRYGCAGDFCDELLGDLRDQAKRAVADAKGRGFKAFFEKMPDGGYRVFSTELFPGQPGYRG